MVGDPFDSQSQHDILHQLSETPEYQKDWDYFEVSDKEHSIREAAWEKLLKGWGIRRGSLEPFSGSEAGSLENRIIQQYFDRAQSLIADRVYKDVVSITKEPPLKGIKRKKKLKEERKYYKKEKKDLNRQMEKLRTKSCHGKPKGCSRQKRVWKKERVSAISTTRVMPKADVSYKGSNIFVTTRVFFSAADVEDLRSALAQGVKVVSNAIRAFDGELEYIYQRMMALPEKDGVKIVAVLVIPEYKMVASELLKIARLLLEV